MRTQADREQATALLFGFSDPYTIFENWLSRYYPDLHAQSIEDSDTEALFDAIHHYYQDGIGESLTSVLPGLEVSP